MRHARLRTKTGCFTCRKRRVKCGEERPCCQNCSNIGHDCIWPSSHDLCDRRNLPKAGQKCFPSSDSNAIVYPTSYAEQEEEPWVNLGFNRSLDSAGIECEDDVDLIYHFLNNFISVLVLPTWNRKHLLMYESELVGMMMHSKGVKCAVLAACAANKYILSSNKRYERLALVYYSRAVWHANQELHRLRLPHQVPSDSLVTTVVYLYLHDIWGLDATVDPRRHVSGAIKLLKMKHDHATWQSPLLRIFDQFTAESILYQAFLLAIRRPFAPNFRVDSQFLVRVRDMLDSQINTSDVSPVLGATHLLYRLILDIINLHTAPERQEVDDTSRLKAEMRHWEAKVLNEYAQDCSSSSLVEKSFYTSTLSLYILAASLLLDWIIESSDTNTPIEPVGFLKNNRNQYVNETYRWQVAHALSILRQPGASETWSRCYLGSWPMLIFGYAVGTEGDIMLIRDLLSDTRHIMGYGENQRILSELEGVWSARRGKGARSPVDDSMCSNFI